ncbi:MAG: DUF1553 domain-containing protein [Planctomycetaceae bacterium]|nr:DUF1553 domain-containing protein [Planctomycetaceae bacterium]
MRSSARLVIWFTMLLAWPVVAQQLCAEQPVDFQSQVAPLIVEHCIRCHSAGIDKGDISLATAEDLVSGGHVVPGEPENSYLLDLISVAEDQTADMPKEGPPLSVAQVELIRRWIAEGAKWPENLVLREKSRADETWWAFQSLAEVQPPAVASLPEAWSHNPVDRFIYAELAKRNLSPSRPASRRELIRRLSFDLHGLPPGPDDVSAFVSDTDPDAYIKLVDRMLASPRYGERYARHWLDIAHYADTHGFERDQRRNNAWRYRDYVISSLNSDKPYDRFLQEQIAGDVLWDSDEALVATGFLAAGPWDFVGQVEARSDVLRRSARALDLDDMVTQVITSTMAMTVNCARCHDHKLDPITQQEYYQLWAVFAGVNRGDRKLGESKLNELQARRSQIRTEIDRLSPGLDLADIVGGGDGRGRGKVGAGLDPRTGKPSSGPMGYLSDIQVNTFAASENRFVDGVFVPQSTKDQAGISISSTGLVLAQLTGADGKAWDAIRNGPVNSQHSPILSEVDFTANGQRLLGLHANAGITFDLAEVRKELGKPLLRLTTQVGYFGHLNESSFADARVLLDGQVAAEFLKLKRADGLQDVDLAIPESVRFLTLLSTDGGNGIGMDQIGFGNLRIKSDEASQSEEQRQRLRELQQDKAELDSQIAAIGTSKVYSIVPVESPPEVRVLRRGDPESQVGEPLAPGGLSALGMLNCDFGTTDMPEGERRAALARWITDPGNPLTSRVIVNRLWHWHFGQGIVDTPSDFGYGGGRPSHPELLDWLAAELRRQNGSLKAMHRLILSSAAYQQSSLASPENPALQSDSDNRLLWRQNAHRIEAEAIRDAVLSVSGKLNLQAGGPGFEDFQYQEAYAPIYTYITADKPELWRRSVYRYIVRTTPDQFLATLDCPDPANMTPARLTTTTPLQSLALYNNAFMLQQAQYFADRLVSEVGDEPPKQVQRAFLLAFGRLPATQEEQLAVRFIEQEGLFAFCRSVFNANEFVYVD